VYPIGHRGKFALQVHTPKRAELAAQAEAKAHAEAGGARPDGAAAAAAAAAAKKEARPLKDKKPPRPWEVRLDHGWSALPVDVAAALEAMHQRLQGAGALARRAGGGASGSSSTSGSGGGGTAHLAEMGGTSYLLDVRHMTQRNVLTGTRRPLRRAPRGKHHAAQATAAQAGAAGRKSSSRSRSASSRSTLAASSAHGHGQHAWRAAASAPRLAVTSDGAALEGSDDALLGALPNCFLLSA
jgi:hypothetical protein